MNISMLSHFVSIIILFGTRFLCYSILMILLLLIVFSRLCLIIRWISIRFWLIIIWFMLSTILRIIICFSFTKTICFWNYYILANWWKTCTYCWSITNDSNIFIFNRWFISMIINIFGRGLCTVKWPTNVYHINTVKKLTHSVWFYTGPMMTPPPRIKS